MTRARARGGLPSDSGHTVSAPPPVGCNYGRLCGSLTVGARDAGQILIGEGLAHPYVCGATSCPRRRQWCETARVNIDSAKLPKRTTGKREALVLFVHLPLPGLIKTTLAKLAPSSSGGALAENK